MIGICASGAPAMKRSWRAGQVQKLEGAETIADGIASPRRGARVESYARPSYRDRRRCYFDLPLGFHRAGHMNIAVVGGTGMPGQRVVQQLRARGHLVKVLSRRSAEHAVGLTTGNGLAHALTGCNIVVDASNDVSRHASKTLVEGSRRLLAAENAIGVSHHVCVSIVGCDQLPVGYNGAKSAQERVVEEANIPWSILRSTQLYEFVSKLFACAARWSVLPVPCATV